MAIDLTQYILKGYSYLPKKDVSIDGGDTIKALVNQHTSSDDKTFGGYSPEFAATLYFATSILPQSLKGKPITIDGIDGRIVTVHRGDYVTSLEVISVDSL